MFNDQGDQMKKLIASFLAVASLSVMAQDKAKTETYKVDSKASTITYVGKKLGGSSHTGNLTIKSGEITLIGEVVTGGQIVVDMNSLTSTDITDKEMNGKFVGHMKSADFFDTAKYPEAKITIISGAATDKGVEVKGDMTFIGQTHPITFLVTDIKKDAKSFSAKSDLNVNRTTWGLKYGSGSFIKGLGDKAINDEFSLNVSIKAKK